MVGFVSVDTDALDAFVERGAQLRRRLDSMTELLVGQRRSLLGNHFPVVSEYSTLPAVGRLVDSVTDLNEFVADISNALEYPDAGYRLRLIELFGMAGSDAPWGRADRLADAELLHLKTLETVFGLLGPDFTGELFERLNALTATADGKEDLARLIAADRQGLGLGRDQVGVLVDDIVAAVDFYASNEAARRRLDAGADRNPGRVDNVFSIRDVRARLAERRGEVAEQISSEILGVERSDGSDACVDPLATTTLLVRNRVMAMTEQEVIAFRLDYSAATGREAYVDLLPQPIGGPGGHSWRREQTGSQDRIAESQHGDLAYILATKLAPELVQTDTVIVDRIDTRVTGSTLSIEIYQGAQISDPAKPDRFTAVVYIDGEPVRNHAGNPKRFPLDGNRFDYQLTAVGEVEVVVEQRNAYGDYRFHTYSTETTDDRVGYASAQLQQHFGGWEPTMESTGSGAIAAVLVSDESSVALPLRLVLEPVGHGGHGWQIIDRTDLENPRTYRTAENSIEAAFDELIEESNLPPGQIAAYHPQTGAELNAYADGTGTWQKVSDDAGTGANVLFVIGGVAYLSAPVTGPAGVMAGNAAWTASSVLGAASAAANIADEVEHDQFDLTSRQTLLSAVEVVGGATAVGGSIYRTGRFVAITAGVDTVSQTAETVVIGAEYYDQIQQVQQDPDLSPTAKRSAIDAIYREALKEASFFVLDVAITRQHERELAQASIEMSGD